MHLCRGAHTVGESATFGGGFPRRKAPLSAVIALIPPWMGHHEFKQLLFRLPFFKRGSIRAENQKVWGRTKMSKEVPRGSRKLKPLTPLLERGGFHAPLLPICLD